MKNIIFICPHCKKELYIEGNSLQCKNRHSYDISKEGYANLLPVNKKKTKSPGDNSEMITARRNFLNKGYYGPLANKVLDTIIDLNLKSSNMHVLDIGCGEGYYSGIINKGIKNKSILTAIDISKAAIKFGSKKYKDINFAVASAYSLPIKDDSVDLAYRIFAPSSPDELNRVIKKGGYLITVTPGNRHLYQLRDIIYNEVKHLKKDEDFTVFHIKNKINLKYPIILSENDDIRNLINMTPFGWKIKHEELEKLLNHNEFYIECDFEINIYQTKN